MSKRTPRIFVYRDRKGEWRWRLKSANGKIVAESGEGYKRKLTPLDVADRLADMFMDACDVELARAESQP